MKIALAVIVGVSVGLGVGFSHGKTVQYQTDKVAVKKLVTEIVKTLNDIRARELAELTSSIDDEENCVDGPCERTDK